MMKVPPASAATKKAYDEIVKALGADDSAMFGMPTMKADGKGFAGLFGDAMVFKLNGDAHATALALKGAVLFDPSGMGRAMKEWVVVPKAHVKKWPDLAASALGYVTGGAPKKKRAPAPASKKKTAAKPAKKKTSGSKAKS
jgi:hypothetical protein